MATDRQRRELYGALESALGPNPAQIMMELLPPLDWSDVARQSDLVAMRGDIVALRGEMRGEMHALRAEMQGEIAALRGEMAEVRGLIAQLRGEFTELRAEVHAQIPKYIMANVPIMAGVAGLVLAAAKLA